MSVLISGIGIGGPALAYWLSVYGIQSTLVEPPPQLRTGGYALDFWGLGFDLAEKMASCPISGATVTTSARCASSTRKAGEPEDSTWIFSGRQTRGRYVTIARTEFARNIYRQVEGHCETIFGDSITGINQRSDRVDVTFEHTTSRRFDVVIGADGLHSVVRKLCFGSEDQFEEFLGYTVAAFEVAGYPHRDRTPVSSKPDGRSRIRLSGLQNATVHARREALLNSRL